MACLKRAKYLRKIDKEDVNIANPNTYWDRTVESVLKTITPPSLFLRDAGIPGERSSQVWASIIEVMHSQVIA